MKITTTSHLEGEEIEEELGILSGEAVMGANLGKDILFSIKNIFGGRATSYEEEFRKGKEEALEDMKKDAKELGADAIIGVRFNYGEMAEGAMLVACFGTAVKLASKDASE